MRFARVLDPERELLPVHDHQVIKVFPGKFAMQRSVTVSHPEFLEQVANSSSLGVRTEREILKCRIVNAKVATTGIGLSTVMIVCSNQSYFEKAKAWCHAGMADGQNHKSQDLKREHD